MTKILFVCSGNVGRSQMAEAYYNHFTKSNDAYSAGTNPKTPQLYPKMPDEICQIMAEEGIDVSNQKVKTIEEHFVEEAERIFVMCEKECCPNFLVNSRIKSGKSIGHRAVIKFPSTTTSLSSLYASYPPFLVCDI